MGDWSKLLQFAEQSRNSNSLWSHSPSTAGRPAGGFSKEAVSRQVGDSLPPAGTIAEVLAFTPQVAFSLGREGNEAQGWAVCCEILHRPRVSFPDLYIQVLPPLEMNLAS